MGSGLSSQGCGGALVSDRYVVTAAHCTNGQSPSGLKVYVGGTSLAAMNESTSFIINVKSIMQHPNYDSSNIANDISILELDSAVDLYSYPTIKPICLPAQGATFPNEQATVSGWGTLSSGGSSPSTLHEVDVTVFADGNCGEMNQYMTPDMLCAGLMEGGKDACQGDSGGPLFISDPANNNAKTLIGAVSWGFGCANPGQLGIYVEVAYFRDWLDAQITSGNTCSPPSASELAAAVPCESVNASSSTPEYTTTTTTSAPGSGSGSESGSGSGSGSGTCGNCVFPFTFGGRKHTTCTTIDGDSPWCATEVDSSGTFVQGKYEYCTDSSCPGLIPPAINVNPNNAVGSCSRGVPNSLNSTRIVGGVETEIGEYPWQVKMLFGDSVVNQGCGGALVADRYVITAAHCTNGQQASGLKVAVG